MGSGCYPGGPLGSDFRLIKMSNPKRGFSPRASARGLFRCRGSSSSKSTISLICARNQGSIFVSWKISSTLNPPARRGAGKSLGVRHAEFLDKDFARKISRSPKTLSPMRQGLRHRPSQHGVSSDAAFCSDSLKVWPMAMASPTLFIWVLTLGRLAEFQRQNSSTT